MAKKRNSYSDSLPEYLYAKTPKAVFAAIAVSVLTIGGDYLEDAEARITREWWALYNAGIVPQRPIFPDPGEE